jgi:hypothetical protein
VESQVPVNVPFDSSAAVQSCPACQQDTVQETAHSAFLDRMTSQSRHRIFNSARSSIYATIQCQRIVLCSPGSNRRPTKAQLARPLFQRFTYIEWSGQPNCLQSRRDSPEFDEGKRRPCVSNSCFPLSCYNRALATPSPRSFKLSHIAQAHSPYGPVRFA